MSDGVRTLARSTALLVGVVLAALLLAAAIVRLPPIQRWAAAQVAARLPAGVSVERAMLTLLPPGVRLANVSFAADGATLNTVTCHVRVRPLLVGRVEIAAVIVDGATLTIERSADGTLGGAGPLPSLLGGPAGSTAPRPQAALTLADLPTVTARNATVTFIDRAARGGPRTLQFTIIRLTLGAASSGTVPLTLVARLNPAGRIRAQASLRAVAAAPGTVVHSAIDATVTAQEIDAQSVHAYLAALVPGGGSAKAEGTLDGSLTLSGSLGAGFAGDAALTQSSGSLLWDQIRCTAPLKLSAHISTGGNGLALSEGRLTIAELAAARATASAIDVAFAYADDTLQLTTGNASAYGGTWSQSGTVALADPPHFDVTLRAAGVACDALLAAVTGEHPQYGCERFDADLALRGQWTGAKSVAQGAYGNGHIAMHGGTIPSSSVVGAVWEALVPLVEPSKTAHVPGDPTRVDHLTQSFALRAGRMHTNDLSLVTDDYTLTGTGAVGLDGRLNLTTEIAMTPAGVTKLLTMASLPLPGDPGNLPPIPTRITGTLGNPIVRPEVEHLPVLAIQGLFEGARGAGEVLGDAVGGGIESLRRGVERLR